MLTLHLCSITPLTPSSLLNFSGFQLVWDHLKMDTVECYWRELLKDYSTLLNWTVVKVQSLVAITT